MSGNPFSPPQPEMEADLLHRLARALDRVADELDAA